MDQDRTATQLALTQAMAGELPDYLGGDNLYHQMLVQTRNGTEQPVMTLGGLLENVETLHWHATLLDAEQQAQLAAIDSKLLDARRVWMAQWQALLRREFKALLDSWQWYLDDAADKERAQDNYASEVHTRTRLDLLARELHGDPASDAARARLAGLDQRLRAMLKGTTYVGPRGTESHYPATQAWWLYGKPVREEGVGRRA